MPIQVKHRFPSLVSAALLVGAVGLALNLTSADADAPASCAQSKINKARRHVACQLRAELLEGAAKEAASAACDRKLVRRWRRAEANGGTACAGTGGVPEVEAFSKLCSSTLADMAGAGAAPPVCTPVSTTTTTLCEDVVVSTTTTTMYVPSHCLNEVTDGDESDVDCGGSCFLCATNQTCNSFNDCFSQVCEDAKCVSPSCDDGVRNGQESGRDCGGHACPPCSNGETCFACDDCESGDCNRETFFGICVP